MEEDLIIRVISSSYLVCTLTGSEGTEGSPPALTSFLSFSLLSLLSLVGLRQTTASS